MNYDNFTPEEKKLLMQGDEDYRRIIKEFKSVKPFESDFINSLSIEGLRKECLDYNEILKHLAYWQKREAEFQNYIETVKSWY